MRCEDMEKIVFSGEAVSEQTREAMRAHAAHCEACRALMENADVLSGARTMDEGVEVPQSFAKGWREAVRSEAKAKPSLTARASDWMSGILGRRTFVRGVAYAMSAVLLVGVGARIGAGDLASAMDGSGGMVSRQKSSNMLMMSRGTGSAPYASDYGMMDTLATAESADMGTDGQALKIVRTAQLSLETEDMDATLESIRRKTAEVGGSITYCEVSGKKEDGRWASIELKVPSASLDAFVGSAGALGEVTRESSSSVDWTERYTDNESRLESARAKKAQLDALYAQAEDMDDIIAITDALFDVQAEIDNLTGANRSIDHRVDYSEVSLTISENPPEEEPEKIPLLTQLWESMQTGVDEIGQFFTNLALFAAWAMPWLAVVGALAAVVCWIRKRLRRRG